MTKPFIEAGRAVLVAVPSSLRIIFFVHCTTDNTTVHYSTLHTPMLFTAIHYVQHCTALYFTMEHRTALNTTHHYGALHCLKHYTSLWCKSLYLKLHITVVHSTVPQTTLHCGALFCMFANPQCPLCRSTDSFLQFPFIKTGLLAAAPLLARVEILYFFWLGGHLTNIILLLHTCTWFFGVLLLFLVLLYLHLVLVS